LKHCAANRDCFSVAKRRSVYIRR